jgi:hypothetical protein
MARRLLERLAVKRRFPVATCALVTVLSGCAAGADSPKSAGTSGNGATSGGAGTGFGTGTAGSGGSGTPGTGGTLPPETELESTYEVPVATGHFIWVANPTSGRVAYINAASFEVHTIEAGNAPTYIAPIPSSEDAVIVLNVLSDDATALRVTAAGLDSRTVRGVAHGANALAVSADGSWAIAWTDARRIKNADPFEGYQNLTVIKLDRQAPTKTIVTAGFRPVSVGFAADGSKAFAVTEDGITVVDLAGAAGPRVSKNVIITDDATEDVDTRDVSLTPNGALALIRREGSAAVGLVDLATGVRSQITLSGPVTDLDLTADGKRAVAVVRDTSEVAILPLDAGAPASSAVVHVTVAGEVVGSVAIAPGGGAALLYSNATKLERITVLTLAAAPTYRVVKLHAPVLSVFPSGDGANAVVLHADTGTGSWLGGDAGPPPDAGSSDVDGGSSEVDAGGAEPPGPRAGRAFSLVPLTADLPAKIQTTDAPPEAVVLSPTGERALITIHDDVKKVYAVYMGLFPTLEVQRVGLASPPIAAGVVAEAGRGYVAQKHPEGRITFVTLDSGEARTLTGFELGSRVVDWTQP